VTKEQHDAVCANRTRPFGDHHMSNARASRWRAEQSYTVPSAVDLLIAETEQRKEGK